MGNETKGKWKIYTGHDHRLGETLVLAPNPCTNKPNFVIAKIFDIWPNHTETDANANLIVESVNGCKSVNQSNPLVVAENITEMVKLLKRINALIESGDWKLPEGFFETEVNWLKSVVNKISGEK